MSPVTTKRGDELYYVRCVPRCDIFEVIKLTVHNVTEEYFTAIAQNRTYLFGYNDKNVYEVFSDAEGDLESRRNTYYSTHSKTKEEKLDMHAVDEFQE